ncbi:hypothetical protein GCM10010178_52970 [Lentzea flava]|uniref:Uncharacterized protein n=1 Tax=Lentzea flava TaxID=103732 RepID=A0ABQ2UTV4_9PSEU|nr:hypothetical protein GCM10010178_52970 [Lentzea flava]
MCFPCAAAHRDEEFTGVAIRECRVEVSGNAGVESREAVRRSGLSALAVVLFAGSALLLGLWRLAGGSGAGGVRFGLGLRVRRGLPLGPFGLGWVVGASGLFFALFRFSGVMCRPRYYDGCEPGSGDGGIAITAVLVAGGTSRESP